MALLRLALLVPLVGAELTGTLQADDECVGSCAVNALQRQARTKITEQEDDWAVDVDFGFDAENFLTEADGKEYNISVGDLGTDELKRLVSMATQELNGREAESHENASETLGASPEEAMLGSANACGFHQYQGNSYKELCFCKLTGNPGCANKKCTCPQGCGGDVVWQSAGTVTFKNRARADGCHPSTVLLTAPKTFIATPRDLKQCGGAAVSVIETLLRDSWILYQSRVGKGSMNQCFHGSHTASVKYLHLQSFCSYASFHAMPNNNHAVGACVKMHSLNEAGHLARQLFN
eukprot:CAMPEP_0181462388 /NCGR_PEP_ID=MMETSP1110-20121109/34370_1 /TAXON_ID=174948 /ORGANISM="Symbiodinium sp., Strain CCMP421" /LENGTH=292 /DNA_ID=CAMNT_0023587047 /DNA_START=48 /DNA_END=923 /DNA_ORIENTATION=+